MKGENIMNENNKNESAYAKIPDFKIPSPREQAAFNLRALMLSKDGDEKCALCKAAEELEKNAPKKDAGFEWFFPFILLLAFGGWENISSITPEALKAISDVLEKGKNGEKEDNHA